MGGDSLLGRTICAGFPRRRHCPRVLWLTVCAAATFFLILPRNGQAQILLRGEEGTGADPGLPEGPSLLPESGIDGASEFKLEKVVVTAKRRGESGFMSERSVSAVESDALAELTPRTVPEALQETPGVFVQQTNHGGGSPILRGMIGPQVLMMVDGVRLNNSVYRTGPLQYLNLLDPLSIDRIEILRGPGSVLYGSDAMGGVIQVFSARYASANSGLATHARLDGRWSGMGVLGGFSYKNFQNLVAGGAIGEQPYSGYENWSALGAVVYYIDGGVTDGWQAKLGYLFARITDAGRTDKLYDSNSLQLYDNDDHLLYGRLHMEFAHLNSDCDLTLSLQHFFELKDNFKVGDDYVERLSVRR
jgi:outer membrane receptor protein involved in Fe transport